MPRVSRALCLAMLLAASSLDFAREDPELVEGSVAAAQEQWGGYRGYGSRRFPPRPPTAASFDGGFNFCRLMYASDRGEPGGSGWSTDYPDADINFSTRMGELTKTTISRQQGGEPNHLSVRIDDPFLFNCPFLSATDVGSALFSDSEARILGAYLEKGGFLWVDDFWGPYAWDNWVTNISKALPPGRYPIVDLTPDHPIYRTLFEFAKVPQVPNIGFWRRSGGDTSERYELSAEVHFRGIADAQGRLMVVMTHNTDISDAWEREAEDPQFFLNFSPQGYAVGLDIVLYGMTH